MTQPPKEKATAPYVLAGKVKTRQITIRGKTYLPGDWIEFAQHEGGYARRLAATDIIDLIDYGALLPENTTITLVAADSTDWGKRLHITEFAQHPLHVQTDVGLWITDNKNKPYIVQNVGAFAAIVHNLNYDFFCAVQDYTINLRQMTFPNKEVIERLLPDLRIPVYSANWIIWRTRSEAAKGVLQTMESLKGVVPLNVALTAALYVNRPYLWVYPTLWK